MAFDGLANVVYSFATTMTTLPLTHDACSPSYGKQALFCRLSRENEHIRKLVGALFNHMALKKQTIIIIEKGISSQ